MNRYLPILSALCIVAAACSQPTAAPDTDPSQRPPQESAPPSQATQGEPSEPVPSFTYHVKDGTTRAYLPLSSPICREDDDAQPRYEVVGLWHFDAGDDRWTPIDIAQKVRYRIECNAMFDLAYVVGHDLPPGTYAVAAEVNGVLERNVFTVGGMSCDEDDPGPTSEDQVALCIVSESSARVRVVPDPDLLEF